MSAEPASGAEAPDRAAALGEPDAPWLVGDEDHDEQLRADVWRSRSLDAELARELGRAEPEGRAASAGFLRRLAGRPALPEVSERELVRRAQAGDAGARAELVEAFLPLIATVARIYRTSGSLQRLELLQEGVVGLLRALERYDPERGVPFWSYASFWVRQAMQQLVAELTRPTVLSDRALRQLARLRDAHHAAVRETGREPGRAELAERTGMTAEQIDLLLSADRPARSLDEPVAGEEGAIGTFGELLADPLAEAEYERVVSRIEADELRTLMAGLSDRERTILRGRYGLDGDVQSLRDLGGRLGLSAERVRQLESRALGKLAAAGRRPDAPADR